MEYVTTSRHNYVVWLSIMRTRACLCAAGSVDSVINSIKVDQCDHEPCIVHKGSDYTVHVNFTTSTLLEHRTHFSLFKHRVLARRTSNGTNISLKLKFICMSSICLAKLVYTLERNIKGKRMTVLINSSFIVYAIRQINDTLCLNTYNYNGQTCHIFRPGH